jgi:hypothetical protein
MPDREFDYLYFHMRDRQGMREDILRVIFEALDDNWDGYVDKRDVRDWVTHEDVFYKLSTAKPMDAASDPREAARQRQFHSRQRNLLKQLELDEKSNQLLQFQDVCDLFSSWSLEEIRLVTDNLLKTFEQKSQRHKQLAESMIARLKDAAAKLKPVEAPKGLEPSVRDAYIIDATLKKHQAELKKKVEAEIVGGKPLAALKVTHPQDSTPSTPVPVKVAPAANGVSPQVPPVAASPGQQKPTA